MKVKTKSPHAPNRFGNVPSATFFGPIKLIIITGQLGNNQDLDCDDFGRRYPSAFAFAKSESVPSIRETADNHRYMEPFDCNMGGKQLDRSFDSIIDVVRILQGKAIDLDCVQLHHSDFHIKAEA
jgi:hypothetical protein